MPPMLRSLPFGVVKLILAVCGVFNLVVGSLAVAAGQVAVAGVALPAGLVLVLAAHIDRFEVLKGLGFEAKTRELKATIEDARGALEHLREVAELTSSVLVDLLSKNGRWDAAHAPADAHAIVERIRATLIGVGSTPNAIRVALSPWTRVVSYDLAHAVLAPVEREHLNASQMIEAQRHTLPTPTALDDPVFVAYQARSKALSQERQRINALWELEEPEQLWLALRQAVHELNFVDPEVAQSVAVKASRFAPQVLRFAATGEPGDAAGDWIREIAEHWEREQRR